MTEQQDDAAGGVRGGGRPSHAEQVADLARRLAELTGGRPGAASTGASRGGRPATEGAAATPSAGADSPWADLPTGPEPEDPWAGAPATPIDAVDPWAGGSAATVSEEPWDAPAAGPDERGGGTGRFEPVGVSPFVPGTDASDGNDGGRGARRSRSGRGGARGGGRGSAGAGWGGRGARGGRGGAQEPPETGAAAVDAEPDHEQVARAVALRLLTGAPRSRAQLAEAMARRDVPEDVAERVLDRFTEVGLVDDAAYAEVLVRSRHAEKGLSRRALAMELRRRGVDPATAAEALEQVEDSDEESAARVLVRRKLASTRGLDREVRVRRTSAMLGRKGYGGGLVSRLVREELAAEGQDEADPWADEPLG